MGIGDWGTTLFHFTYKLYKLKFCPKSVIVIIF